MDATTSDSELRPVHIFRLPIGWILLTAFATAVVLLLLGTQSPISVNTTPDGTEYRSTSRVYFDACFLAISVITGCLGLLYSMQNGVFRLVGFALFAITGWLIYSVATTDTSNHHVLVTPTSVTSESGTRSAPVIQTIDFFDTAYIRFVEVTQDNRSSFDLVALAATDGRGSCIPVHDLMRAALPQIVETIGGFDIVIGESDTGGFVPRQLQ